MPPRGEPGASLRPGSVFQTRGWACDGYLRMVIDLKKKANGNFILVLCNVLYVRGLS